MQRELDHLNSSISTRCKDVLYVKGLMYKYKFYRALFDEYYEKSFNFLSFNFFEIQSFENIVRFT